MTTTSIPDTPTERTQYVPTPVGLSLRWRSSRFAPGQFAKDVAAELETPGTYAEWRKLHLGFYADYAELNALADAAYCASVTDAAKRDGNDWHVSVEPVKCLGCDEPLPCGCMAGPPSSVWEISPKRAAVPA